MILSSLTGIVFLESVIYETVYAKYTRNQPLHEKTIKGNLWLPYVYISYLTLVFGTMYGGVGIGFGSG